MARHHNFGPSPETPFFKNLRYEPVGAVEIQHVSACLERPIQALDAARDINGAHVGLLSDVVDPLQVRRAKCLDLNRAEQVRRAGRDTVIVVDDLAIRHPERCGDWRIDHVRRCVGDAEDVNH